MSEHTDHRTPEEIEKALHRSRERLDETLSEIEERFSPQRLLNASYDYLRHGGANTFFTNLGTTIRDNPVPFLVTGVGLGWLLTARRSDQAQGHTQRLANVEAYPHSGPQGPGDDNAYARAAGMSSAFSSASSSGANHRHAAGLSANGPLGAPSRPRPSAFSHPPAFDDAFRDKAARREPPGFGRSMEHDGDSVKERMADRARQFGHGVSQATHHVSDRAHDMGESMRDSRSHLYHSTRHGMNDAGEWVRNAGRHSSDFIQEHPLVAGALGFAIGAALGGLLPSTRREDAAMGEYRDRLVDEAAERGHEQADKMQHALHERTEKMKHDADNDKGQGQDRDKDHKDHQEHDPRHTPSETDGEHMRYSDEAMPGHNAASGMGGNPGKAPAPHDKDRRKNEHGLADSDTPSGNTQGDDTLEPPKR